MQHALTVDASDLDGGVEKTDVAHIPLSIQQSIAETRLQFAGHRAVALVYFYMILVVNVTQYVVAGDGMAASGEEVGVDVAVVDDDSLLPIECIIYGEWLGLLILFVFLIMPNEGYILEPIAG